MLVASVMVMVTMMLLMLIVQGERAFYDAVVNQKLDSVKLFLRHNYDLDMPCKLDYDGSGGKLPVRVAVERDLGDIQRLLARLGYVFSVATPSPPAAATSSQPTAAAGSGGGGQVPVSGGDNELAAVRSLRLQCRRQIRRLLGFGIATKTAALPLPASVKDFILLKDLLED